MDLQFYAKKELHLCDSKKLQEWREKIRKWYRKMLIKIHTVKTITLVLSHRWRRL